MAKEEKELDEDKKSKKKAKKEKAKAESENGGDEEEEKLGGKLVLALVTILIIAIWLAIFALLIRMDVGGFGSTVLYPLLKDVPYVNRILPEMEEEYETEVDPEHDFDTIDDAVTKIRDLEQQLADAQSVANSKDDTIAALQSEINELAVYRDEQESFEKEKEKFYEEVVFSDEAPDISTYREYYESIDPENAAVIYKQVVEQQEEDEELKNYVNTYSSMKPKEAAAIFNTMTNDLGLVAKILKAMNATSRADILGKMNSDTAAKVTAILEP